VDSLADAVIHFVAGELHAAPGTLSPESTLAGDLGLSGDRAARFLEAFEDRFETDLSPLYAEWERYFTDEEVIPRELVIPLLAMGVTAGLAAWVAFAVFIAAGLYAARHYRRRVGGTAAITIADLIEAARAGYWPANRI
jgi:hypothetical protein